MSRSKIAVVAVAAGILAASGAVATAAPSPSVSTVVPQRYLDFRIDWTPCYGPGKPPPSSLPTEIALRAECGWYLAPMNWNRPDDKIDIEVAVSRLRPVSGEPKGTVFTNSGGPGSAGKTFPLKYIAKKPRIAENMELIGIDVRGTGDSTRVDCGQAPLTALTMDARDRSRQNLDRIYDSYQQYAKSCQTASGDFGKYVNTEQTVQDLDLLRALLGRDKIDYIGYSAGTWLGAHYATYFPDRVGRFVLDSNVDFTATYQDIVDAQPAGFERRFRADFLPWVAKNEQTYHFGTTAEQSGQAYERLRAQLAKTPVSLPDGTSVTGTGLDVVLITTQYDKNSFPLAARSLTGLQSIVDGHGSEADTTAVAAAVKNLDQRKALNPAFYATQCNDTAWRGDRRSMIRQSAELGKQYPLYGWYQPSAPCVFWNRPALELKQPTGQGVPPVLMVQSERDPATPYEGALRAHQGFAGSRMLTVTNDGDHGIYAEKPNPCVDDIVESFVVDNSTPTGDLSCPGMPLP